VKENEADECLAQSWRRARCNSGIGSGRSTAKGAEAVDREVESSSHCESHSEYVMEGGRAITKPSRRKVRPITTKRTLSVADGKRLVEGHAALAVKVQQMEANLLLHSTILQSRCNGTLAEQTTRRLFAFMRMEVAQALDKPLKETKKRAGSP